MKDLRGGPINRPKKFPVRVELRISEEAHKTLRDMAIVKDTTVGTLLRRAVMKDVYIYKAEKKKRDIARLEQEAETERQQGRLPCDDHYPTFDHSCDDCMFPHPHLDPPEA